MSLHKMIIEMQRKKIELARISKCSVQLILSGLSPNSIPSSIIRDIVSSQKRDGGFVSNTDTIWNIKLLSFFPEYGDQRKRAMTWLSGKRTERGFGRSYRDIPRIPVSGLAFYLNKELCRDIKDLEWLENLWLKEKNSLTYKAAYVLLAFRENNYFPSNNTILEIIDWLEHQQENDGGFSPWKGHPVGSNIYCTALAILGLSAFPDISKKNVVDKAYSYIIRTQLINGIWPYHELEDGGAWGLRAITEYEKYSK